MRNLLIAFVFIGLFTACASSSKKATHMNEMHKMNGMHKAKAESDSTAQAAAEKVQCSLKKDVRTIEMVSDSKDSCHVDYTKNGEKNNVAQSTKGNAHCLKVHGRIKANLEKAGFVCK